MIGKVIKMNFGSKVEEFRVTAENPTTDKGMYYFMECDTNPAARGFYSQSYIDRNFTNK